LTPRQQVAPTLAAVQKDFTSAATQAKAELNRLQVQAAEARAQAAASEAAGGSAGGESFAGLAMMGDMGIGGMPAGLSVDSDAKGKGREGQLEEDVRKGVEQAGEALSSLFNKLQASLPKGTVAQEPTLDAGGKPIPGTGSGGGLPSLAAFQQSLSSTLSAHPNLNPATLNVTDLRASLTTTFQKLQTDLHLADAERLAEEYLRKSEGVLSNAGQFLSDAIKIVPPTEAGDEADIGVSWDGSDAWAVPLAGSDLNARGGRLQFAQSDAQVARQTGKSLATVRQTRHLASLDGLRSNRSLLLVDPAAAEGVDADVREAWGRFSARFAEEGGIEGEKWTEKTWAELGPTKDKGVEELKALRDELGQSQPHLLPKSIYARLTRPSSRFQCRSRWTRRPSGNATSSASIRYVVFILPPFRTRNCPTDVHSRSQIELDAERRSALLDTTTAGDAEDDFSWEDDEDDSKPTSPSAAAATPKAAIGKSPVVLESATVPKGQTTPTPSPEPTTAAGSAEESKEVNAAPLTAQTSPRDSSEGSSYDIVSNTSGQTKPSVVSSPAPTVQGSAPASTKAADEEDEDSDWE